MRRQLEMLNLQRALVEAAPTHPLLMKLEQHGTLQAADRDLLSRMLADIRTFDSRRDIIRVGENPEYVHLMIGGWACRYSIVNDGRRQITAFLVLVTFAMRILPRWAAWTTASAPWVELAWLSYRRT
jgi:hypothetical protein